MVTERKVCTYMPENEVEQCVSILNASFANYKAACYGDTELSADQLLEVRQAYLSGMVWLAGHLATAPVRLTILCRAIATILELSSTVTTPIDEAIAKGG